MPIERATPFVVALKVQRSPLESLHLEYRQPIGYDATSVGSFADAGDGVQIRTTYFGGETTALIRPNGAFSLATGQTYDAGSFTVTTLWSGPDGTTLDIEFR